MWAVTSLSCSIPALQHRAAAPFLSGLSFLLSAAAGVSHVFSWCLCENSSLCRVKFWTFVCSGVVSFSPLGWGASS